MSSMRLFNKEYLFQNIKKSRGALCVFVCLVPILNFILLLFLASTSPKGIVLTLEELSLFNYVGIFIIPLVLSICFFGFVFKKKQVDFINSMPLSRASIFVTNTVGGILIILAMMIINVILISLISLCSPNLIIPSSLIVDYFIFWLVSYIFVFTVSNISVSLSGNAITSIVVTALILFLIPFCHQYIVEKNGRTNNKLYIECNDKLCAPQKYDCTGVSYCNLKAKNKVYLLQGIETKKYDNYTMPYLLIYDVFNNSIDGIFSVTRVLKMFILSIIYLFVGLFVFSKRKMENSEISFNNINVHLIIKCMTLVPIMILFYELFSIDKDISSLIVLAIFIVLLLAYYFIYDLITKHGIKNIKLSLLYFVSAILILYGACALNEYTATRLKKDVIIKEKDIISAKVSFDSRDLIDININDRDIINTLISYGLEKINFDTDEDYNQIWVSYYTGSKTYKKLVNVSNNDFDFLLQMLEEKDVISKRMESIFKRKFIGYEVDGYVFKYDSALDKILNDISSNFDINEYNNVLYSNSCAFTIYEYKNHKLRSYRIPCSLSDELKNYIDLKRKEILERILENEYILNISIRGDVNPEFYDKYYYVRDEVRDELLDYISKNIGNDYDVYKKTLVLTLYSSLTSYDYYTNDVDMITSIIDKKIDEVKDTEDYKEYLNNLDSENTYKDGEYHYE